MGVPLVLCKLFNHSHALNLQIVIYSEGGGLWLCAHPSPSSLIQLAAFHPVRADIQKIIVYG